MASNLQLVIDYNHEPATTSLLVAEKFEKRHDDVLKAIRNIECSAEFRARNFAGSSYKSMQNRDLPMFIITRDGFTMLMMSFTGSAAAKFREDFIAEFNRMESVIKGKTPVLLPTYSKRILSEPTKNVPKGYWCVFDRVHKIMLQIEKHVGSVSEYDLVDGSIGKAWANFRKGKFWALESSSYSYEFEDQRGSRECKCYQNDEYDYFEEWLDEIYRTTHLAAYLKNKFHNQPEMLKRIDKFLPPELN